MSVPPYCHSRLNLGFLAKLRIFQASACKMEPWSGIISCKKPPTNPPAIKVWKAHIMSVPTFYVCPHLICLSPPIMSVPTFYVCPHLLCLSSPYMSVPTFHVCPDISCLSPPIIVFADKPLLNFECLEMCFLDPRVYLDPKLF